MSELTKKISALLPLGQGNPAAMIQLAHLLRRDGQRAQALRLCQEALTLGPSDAWVVAQVNEFLSQDVPAWHFRIIRDNLRNAAYEAAMRRVIKPHSRVLEIGTGTGLLAMMAARAGAAEVITCEMNIEIAEMASRIVEANGFSDRVRVVAKHSDELDVAMDLGGPMDILVSEIVSNDLLGEGVLASHERAVRDFLKPNGITIPARGFIRVALAEDTRREWGPLGKIEGFDLSGFNGLRQMAWQMAVDHEQLQLRSSPADLFSFNFDVSSYCAPGRASVDCVATGGRVNGMAQWIALEMDEETRYENQPAPLARSCWAVLFHPLPNAVETFDGQRIRVSGSHNRRRVLLWCDSITTGISTSG